MLEILLIAKLGLRKLDISAIVQLSVCLIAALFRMLLYVVPGNDTTFIQLIGVLTMLASWGLLYYMVFEMMYIRATLESESHQESTTRKHRIHRQRITLFGIYLTVYAPMSIFVFIGLKDYADFYKRNILFCRILLIIRALLRLVIDGWMFTKFIDNFYFFLKRKVQ